jgi:hypothetical protein
MTIFPCPQLKRLGAFLAHRQNSHLRRRSFRPLEARLKRGRMGGLPQPQKETSQMTDIDAIAASIKQHRQAVTAANEHNKPAVFDALVAAGITTVTVEFDGASDQGQIDSVIACAGELPVELPKTPVTLQHVSWQDYTLTARTEPLPEAIETLCYDYLEQEHGGWENNDGAFGSFAFDVAGRHIHLEFNGRFTSRLTYDYDF